MADDSRLELTQIVEALPAGFTVEQFDDGEGIIEAVARGGAPDVVITDWVMPGVSGLDVIQFLRAHPRGADIGILVLTARGSSSDLRTAFFAGADDFVFKPVLPEELHARINRMLQRHDAHQQVEEQFLGRWLEERKQSQEAKQRELEERQRKEEAQERMQLAELFMGILGHDLRTPLSSIVMANAILQRDVTEERRRLATRRIAASVARMTELIGRMLDVTRSRLGGGIPLAPARHDARLVCERVIDELSAANPDRPIELNVDGDTELPVDADRLAQVLSNLVGNALEYGLATEPIAVRMVGEPDKVRIEIVNHGPPIPENVVATIFEPFRRAVDHAVSPTGSMGLGLYIAKQIVEAHGGAIAVRSDAASTAFTVTLPRQP